MTALTRFLVHPTPNDCAPKCSCAKPRPANGILTASRVFSFVGLLIWAKSSKYFRIALIVAVVTAVGSSVSCGLRKKPSRAVEDMIRTVERGEIDEAAKFNSQGFITRNGIDSIKESLRQTALWIKRDGGIRSVEVLKEDAVGDVAEVTIKVTRGGGDSSVVHYKLIWENGDWKIDWLAAKPTAAPMATPSVSL